MGLFNFNKPRPRMGDLEWDGQAFDLDDPRIPRPIREAARQRAEPGDVFYFTNTVSGGEWWQVSADGELVEAYWLE